MASAVGLRLFTATTLAAPSLFDGLDQSLNIIGLLREDWMVHLTNMWPSRRTRVAAGPGSVMRLLMSGRGATQTELFPAHSVNRNERTASGF